MRLLLLLLTLPLFVLDYATKEYIVQHFQAPPPPDDPRYGYFVTDSVPVIDGFFEIVRVHNTGVAWGLGNGKTWANIVFGTVSTGALVLIWYMHRRNTFPTRLSRVGVALIVAGVLGNMLDRLLRGYVVDFLRFHYGEHEWPSFNVADSCIFVAACLLFVSAFQKAPAPRPPA